MDDGEGDGQGDGQGEDGQGGDGLDGVVGEEGGGAVGSGDAAGTAGVDSAAVSGAAVTGGGDENVAAASGDAGGAAAESQPAGEQTTESQPAATEPAGVTVSTTENLPNPAAATDPQIVNGNVIPQKYQKHNGGLNINGVPIAAKKKIFFNTNPTDRETREFFENLKTMRERALMIQAKRYGIDVKQEVKTGYDGLVSSEVLEDRPGMASEAVFDVKEIKDQREQVKGTDDEEAWLKDLMKHGFPFPLKRDGTPYPKGWKPPSEMNIPDGAFPWQWIGWPRGYSKHVLIGTIRNGKPK